jgi:hypothetical protein
MAANGLNTSCIIDGEESEIRVHPFLLFQGSFYFNFVDCVGVLAMMKKPLELFEPIRLETSIE